MNRSYESVLITSKLGRSRFYDQIVNKNINYNEILGN